MKKIFTLFILLVSATAFSQTDSSKQESTGTLPDVTLKNVDGEDVNIADYGTNGKITIISFWATWCKPCKKELNTIAEAYEDWQDETGVKLVAVSIDNSRSMAKVAPYVNASDWDYEVYIDPNGDLKRALGISTVPHTFLLNSKKEIVWQHKGYVDGDEEELFEQIKKLAR